MNSLTTRMLLFAVTVLMGLGANAQCLSDWAYNAPVKVSNATNTPLFNFQVRLVVDTKTLIDNGKMKADGADIRFTTNSSCATLPYWVEEGMNTNNTIVWVKTPSIPSNGTQDLLIYYGNPNAASESNGDNTFDFFEDDWTDFPAANSTSLNALTQTSSISSSKWSLKADGNSRIGVVTVNGNKVLKLFSRFSNGATAVMPASSVPGPITAESKIVSATFNGTQNYHSLGIVNGSTSNGYALVYTGGSMALAKTDGASVLYYASDIKSSNSQPGTIAGIWGVQWPVSNLQNGMWPGGDLSASATDYTIANTLDVAVGCLSKPTSVSGNINFQLMEIDWFRIRQYVDQEPGTEVELDNEQKNDISLTTLSVAGGPFGEGDKIDVPFTLVGNYASENIFTAQLSDSNGNFTNAINIGTMSGNTAGTIIDCQLPAGAVGTGYRIRVISSSPAIVANDVPITIHPRPAANTGNNQSVCFGSACIIGAEPVAGSTYSWTSSPEGFTSSEAGPVVMPSITTTYTLVETNEYGISSTNSVTVTVNELPNPSAGTDLAICAGSSASIGAAANVGSSYQWSSIPAGFTSTKANPQVSPSSSTTYVVHETNANGCTGSDTVNVSVNALPVASITGDTVFYYGYISDITLTASSTTSSVSYNWSTGDTTQSISVSPSATMDYWLTVSVNGCTSIADTVKMYVVDVRCHDEADYKGKDKNLDKVEMCHNGNRVCVSKGSVASHLAHGDKLGCCNSKHYENCPENSSTSSTANGNGNGNGKGKRDLTETTIPSKNFNNNNISEARFTVYPNPFSNTATVDVILAGDQNIVIDLMSIDGKTVSNLYNGLATGNTQYKFTLDGSSLKAGLYLVRLQSNNTVSYKQINLIR